CGVMTACERALAVRRRGEHRRWRVAGQSSTGSRAAAAPQPGIEIARASCESDAGQSEPCNECDPKVAAGERGHGLLSVGGAAGGGGGGETGRGVMAPCFAWG